MYTRVRPRPDLVQIIPDHSEMSQAVRRVRVRERDALLQEEDCSKPQHAEANSCAQLPPAVDQAGRGGGGIHRAAGQGMAGLPSLRQGEAVKMWRVQI